MQTKPSSESTRSPVPGVIPEPIQLRHETVAAHERDGVANDPAPPPARKPASSPLARLLSALRGDRYMVGAYPPDDARTKEQ